MFPGFGVGLRLAGAVWKPAATLAGGALGLNELNNLKKGIVSGIEKDLYDKKGKWNEDTKEYRIEDKGLFQSLGQHFNLVDSDKEIGKSKLAELHKKMVDQRNIVRSADGVLPELNPTMTPEEARNTMAQSVRTAKKTIKNRDERAAQELLKTNPEYLLREEESKATIENLKDRLALTESQNKDQNELTRERMAQQERMEQARLNQQNNRDMFMIQERMFDRSHQRRRDTQNAMLGLAGGLAAILSA